MGLSVIQAPYSGEKLMMWKVVLAFCGTGLVCAVAVVSWIVWLVIRVLHDSDGITH